MQRTEPPLIAVAILLAALAGFVDALAFTALGGFFASFMSGNSTRLGVGLATGAGGDAILGAALVLNFASGVILAAVIARAAGVRHMAAVAAGVAALLIGAALTASLVPGPLPLLLSATAMGGGHLLLRRTGTTTGLTDALVRLGERLAAALMGDADRWSWLPHLLLWAGFIAGVVLGAGAYLRLGAHAYWIAAMLAGAFALAAARRPARASAR